MASKISWTDETWNPVVGCTKCSPGCQNCYAERMAHRLIAMGHEKYYPVMSGSINRPYGWNGEIVCDEESLDKPLHWRKPRRIFVVSMGDLFHEKVPFEFIRKVWQVMDKCRQHTFQILTKRPEIALEFSKTSIDGISWHLPRLAYKPLPNVHLGVSISNLDELWKGEELARIPTAVRFVSFEPLLADMGDITPYLIAWHIHWVIIGCESINGRAGRLLLPEHINNPMSGVKISKESLWNSAAIDLVRQCKAAGVPVFVKQIPLNGKVSKKMAEWPKELRIQEKPDGK